jgi:hypothetical protein
MSTRYDALRSPGFEEKYLQMARPCPDALWSTFCPNPQSSLSTEDVAQVIWESVIEQTAIGRFSTKFPRALGRLFGDEVPPFVRRDVALQSLWAALRLTLGIGAQSPTVWWMEEAFPSADHFVGLLTPGELRRTRDEVERRGWFDELPERTLAAETCEAYARELGRFLAFLRPLPYDVWLLGFDSKS